MKRSIQIWIAVAAFAAGALSAAAQGSTRIYREGGEWVQETTGTIPFTRMVRVRVHQGSVSVNGGAQKNITYTARWRSSVATEEEARRAFEQAQMNVSRSGDTTVMSSDWAGPRWRHIPAEFIIVVPRETELVKATTDCGELQFAHINGRVEAESGAGNVHLDDIGGPGYLKTGGGNIGIGSINGDIKLESGAGNIQVNSAGGSVTAETGGGNIYLQSAKRDANLETGAGLVRVDKVGGNLRAATGGNSIEIGEVGGALDLETGGGNIRSNVGNGFIKAETGGGSIQCFRVGRGLMAETGAGTITAEFVVPKGQLQNSKIETGAGNIVVYLPSDMAVTIRAGVDAAMGTAIQSDFPNVKITAEGGDFGPREMYLEGSLNGGGPLLKLHTSTGTIQVLQLKK